MPAHLDSSLRGQGFGDSERGFIWRMAEFNETTVRMLCQKLDLPEVLAKVLYNRGVRNELEARFFLEPKLMSHMPNPFGLIDMDKAAARISRAVMNDEKIAIFGDYDVDGATSTALLKRFLSIVGTTNVEMYIPNRITEGYGPNKDAFSKLKERGNTLVITVDCGTVSFEPLMHAAEIGLDVVVLDHHLSLDKLPTAVAVVNPNRFDETFGEKYIAAVGVAFLTAVAVRSKLRELGHFARVPEPDIMHLLDLVALGTVCDVMNLTGVNRAFVSQGLKVINRRTNVGLSKLTDIAHIENAIHSHHLGFSLGPLINAGGRVGEGGLGAQLLSTDDPHLALELALKLERLNQERRAIESLTLEHAMNKIETQGLYNDPVIVVSGHMWHQGILGIIASRLKEKYKRPAAVISFDNNKLGKGSARSITGVDMGSLLGKAKSIGILTQGGGHPMAGGFSLHEDNLEDLQSFFKNHLDNIAPLALNERILIIDTAIAISAINGTLVRLLEKAAPFGPGNTNPRLLLQDVVISHSKVIGKSHIMIIITDNSMQDSNKNCSVKCVLFKSVDTNAGQKLLRGAGKRISLVGYVQAHYIDSSKADFIVEDVKFL